MLDILKEWSSLISTLEEGGYAPEARLLNAEFRRVAGELSRRVTLAKKGDFDPLTKYVGVSDFPEAVGIGSMGGRTYLPRETAQKLRDQEFPYVEMLDERGPTEQENQWLNLIRRKSRTSSPAAETETETLDLPESRTPRPKMNEGI